MILVVENHATTEDNSPVRFRGSTMQENNTRSVVAQNVKMTEDEFAVLMAMLEMASFKPGKRKALTGGIMLLGVHIPQGGTLPQHTADMKNPAHTALFHWLHAFYLKHGITDFTTIHVGKNVRGKKHTDNNGNTYNNFFTVGGGESGLVYQGKKYHTNISQKDGVMLSFHAANPHEPWGDVRYVRYSFSAYNCRRTKNFLEENTALQIQLLPTTIPATNRPVAPELLDDDTACEVCGSCEGGDTMLLCDSCDKGFHLGCLNPALVRVPEGKWFCEACQPLSTPDTDDDAHHRGDTGVQDVDAVADNNSVNLQVPGSLTYSSSPHPSNRFPKGEIVRVKWGVEWFYARIASQEMNTRRTDDACQYKVIFEDGTYAHLWTTSIRHPRRSRKRKPKRRRRGRFVYA